jgi:uncharacterized protein (DUF927 family)
MSYPRQQRFVHVLRADESGGVGDIAREQWRLMLQEASDEHAKELGKVRTTQEELEERVIHLEEEIERLFERDREETLLTAEKFVMVKEVSRDQARRLVENYMREHQTADTEELLTNLRIGLRNLVEILDQLKAEGKIRAELD